MPMPQPTDIVTDRLVLRRWRESDHVPFAAMNVDPAVMEFFPSTLTRQKATPLSLRLRGTSTVMDSAFGRSRFQA